MADVDPPDLDVGQVLVKVDFSGLCGKQLDEIRGTRGKDPYLPHLLGHEGAGTVLEVGPGVRKTQPDDRVVLHWMKGSGIDSATPTYRWNGADVNAGWVTTFNEYCVVSENRVTPVPSDVPGDAACLLGCAATTGLGIVFNDAKLRPGQSIAVFGAGGVGLNVIQGAALVSAFPIVAVDLHDDKLERSSGFGATHTVNMGREGAVDTLTEIVGTRGYDVAVDTTGNPRVFETAYRLTAPRGTTVLAGVLPEAGGSVTLDPFPLHFGRRIVGSHGGDTDPDTDIPRYVDLYRRGKLKLNEQITHRFPLSRINEATESLQHGAQVGRCVISMES